MTLPPRSICGVEVCEGGLTDTVGGCHAASDSPLLFCLWSCRRSPLLVPGCRPRPSRTSNSIIDAIPPITFDDFKSSAASSRFEDETIDAERAVEGRDVDA
jgi:hypothetical protein